MFCECRDSEAQLVDWFIEAARAGGWSAPAPLDPVPKPGMVYVIARGPERIELEIGNGGIPHKVPAPPPTARPPAWARPTSAPPRYWTGWGRSMTDHDLEDALISAFSILSLSHHRAGYVTANGTHDVANALEHEAFRERTATSSDEENLPLAPATCVLGLVFPFGSKADHGTLPVQLHQQRGLIGAARSDAAQGADHDRRPDHGRGGQNHR